MLANVRAALEEHAGECCQNPKAILLHPGNHALIGWDEVLGLYVLPDARVEPKRFLLVCGDQGWGGFFENKPVWWTEDGVPHRRRDDDDVSVA